MKGPTGRECHHLPSGPSGMVSNSCQKASSLHRLQPAVALLWLLAASAVATSRPGLSRGLLSDELQPSSEGEDYEFILPAETKARELDQMKGWISDTPHAPGQELAEALAAAAYKSPSSSSNGIIILNCGSKFAFDELLPRWLDSMTTTLDGDISRHTLILTLGSTAQELCTHEQKHASHQCVYLPHWLGPDRMLHFGDEWYTVVTLSKLELMLNVLSLGYIPVWMDTDMVHIRNPLPYLAAMDADVAVTGEHCFSTLNDPALIFELNTGIMKLEPNAQTVRWMTEWVEIQKAQMLALLERGWETVQPLHRPHDQVTFHQYMLPQLKGNATHKPLMKLDLLTQQHFPNFCGGWCGCEGPKRRPASRIIAHTNRYGHLMTGRVECPLEIWKNWYSYHVPCVHSFHEKVALIDTYQSSFLKLFTNASAHVQAPPVTHRLVDAGPGNLLAASI